MPLKVVEEPPKGVELIDDHDELASKLSPDQIEHVIEIFNTPLTGSYNWDYTSADGRIKKLYALGKQLNWDASMDVDWSIEVSKKDFPSDKNFIPFVGFPEYEALSEEKKIEFIWHNHAWTLGQFLHGEQGALLVASQLASCAPTFDAKLYAASQTFDEARHVEVFAKYLKEKVGIFYPINKHLKVLLDKVLTDPRWDLKFIGMQIIIEGLALAAFNTMKMITHDPLLKDIVHLVIRDEARHVTFGVNYLEEFVKTLSEEEKEERAMFAYEACVVMRERLIATDVFEHFGWDVEAARQQVLQAEVMEKFRMFLFTRIIPNLKRIGLLTDNVREKYQELGILQFENLVDDGVIEWSELEKPLYEDGRELPSQQIASNG
ncbi:MAG: ferritin-like domain-containing protein [Pseudomonadales bacterium]|nr:ferritin-like domain-containing protein [Pseudomonadales bacterium]